MFGRSLLVALSNPKGLLFFSALLPQFIDPQLGPVTLPMYSAVLFVIGVLVFVLLEVR